MSPSYSLLSWLAPGVLMLLGMGLCTLWNCWRRQRELAWLGASFLASSLGMVVQLLYWPGQLLPYVLAFSVCYLVAVGACAQAVALRLSVQLPLRAATLLVVALLCGQIWFSALQPNLEMRVYLFSCGLMLLMGLPLLRWRQMDLRGRFDGLLRGVYLFCIASNLLRTLWLAPLSVDVPAEDFTRTWFWVGVHFFAMAACLLLGATMLLCVVWDVLHGLKQERNLDPLTRLLNRRAFYEKARQRAEQHEDAAAPPRWMLLVCDLDNFKWVNDSWGHAAGDGVLQVTAELLRRNVRATDLVARFGGEEFVVLMECEDMTTAMHVAERIRREMSQIRLPTLVGERVTLSIGVAMVPSLAREALQAAIAQADQSLFAAKRAGRNRVRGGQVPAPPSPPHMLVEP